MTLIFSISAALMIAQLCRAEINSDRKEIIDSLRTRLNAMRSTHPSPAAASRPERPETKNAAITPEKAEPVSETNASAPVKNALSGSAQNPIKAVYPPEVQKTEAVRPEAQNYVKPARAASPVLIPEPIAPANIAGGDPEAYSVVLDPGHGGKYEPARANSGDHWDPFSRTFLLPYNFGAQGSGIYEHEWTLQVAKKVDALLAMTKTDKGFSDFAKILQKYMSNSGAPIRKVRINTILTRNFSHDSEPNKNVQNINAKYRLFDSPASFNGKTPSSEMALGRISYINQISPDLVVCLHVNSSPNRSARGMSAVIAPHFQFFSSVNNLITSGGPQAHNKSGSYSQVADFIATTFKKLSTIDTRTIISDTATYFTGFRAFTNKFIGLRYLMVTWRYNTNSPLSSFILFFMRENSIYECYKRAGGPEGYGGDNFYSSQELIRFIRLSLMNNFSAVSKAAGSQPDELLGKHGEPFVSDWAIPLFTNAITAFIEVGYLSNPRDRMLLKNNQDAIAEGIAVGIYSLFAGLEIKKQQNLESPKALPIDFTKYGRNKTSNGYFNLSCERLPF